MNNTNLTVLVNHSLVSESHFRRRSKETGGQIDIKTKELKTKLTVVK